MPFFGHGLCDGRAGGFESHAPGANKNGPLSRTVSKSVVGDEGCRVRLTPPALASGLRPSRAALENASRFLSSAPLRVRIPLRWAQKRKAPIAGSLSNQWWAMRDVRVRLAPPAPRFVAPLLACCAGKRFAFPQLRTLAGSNPSALGPKKKGPHSWEPIKSVVGDEGFEPPALCV